MVEECLREVRPGRRLWVRKRSDRAKATKNLLSLLVHGGCAHSQQWQAQEDVLLNAGLVVMSWDALGCGHSEKPHAWGAYSGSEHYEDLLSIFDTVRQDYDGIILVGHSFGAALALRLAAEAGQDVVGLILVGTYFPPERGAKPGLLNPMRWLFYLPTWVLRWLTEGFLSAAFAKTTHISQPKLVEQERQHSNANPPYMFKAFHRQLSNFGSREQFLGWASSVSQPVAVVYGDADGITPVFPNSSLLLRRLAQGELSVIKDAGHQAMQEQPAQVNAVIDEFLAKVTGS